MTLREALISIGLAVGAGALIGAEREQARLVGEGDDAAPPSAGARHDFGGIRTFPLIALTGALAALAAPVAGFWLLGLSLAGLAALLVAAYLRASGRARGLTTEVAAMLTFLLGALAALPGWLPEAQRWLLVASAAGIVMVLLALKGPLHGFAAKVRPDDVYATAKFAILALVVLPLLPDRTYGPFGVLNPSKLGLFVVLVAGVSFAGYVAARAVGARLGILVTGLLGGLVSSTAVTLTFSGRAREQPALAPLCAIAVLAACATMFARVLVIVGAVDPPLLAPLTIPLAAMAAGGFGAAGLFFYLGRRTSGPGAEEVPLRNPFQLGQAIKFGVAYAVVLVAAKAAETYLGSGGVLASSVLAGITDVDAITLSLAELHRGGMSTSVAATGIALASVTNTVVKAGIALVIGGRPLGRRVGAGLLAALAAGGVAAVVLARSAAR